MSGCGSSSYLPFPSNRSPTISAIEVDGSATPSPSPSASATPVASPTPTPTPSPTPIPAVLTFTVLTGSDHILHAVAHDKDNDPVTYKWYGADDTAGTSGSGSAYAKYSPTDAGTKIVSVVVTDDRNGSATRSIQLIAKVPDKNNPPAVSLTSDVVAGSTLALGGTAKLTATKSDPDTGDTVTLTYYASQGTFAVDAMDDTKATYTAPASAGTVTIVCVATDSKGATSTSSIKISVK